MREEYIEFKHWKTGEKMRYSLNFSHPSENKTDLICPLDNTPLVYAYDDLSKIHFCPNCETIYFHKVNSQESVQEYFQEHLLKLKEDLFDLDKKRKDITSFLEKAEESVKNKEKNKANLSAKVPEPTNVDKSKVTQKYNLRESQFTPNSRLNH